MWRLRISVHRSVWLGVGAVIVALGTASCVPRGRLIDRAALDAEIRRRTTHGIRTGGEAPVPPDVVLDDGVTADEAVAVALWNSPAFELALADLGIARAELVDAGLLRNPILSLLFPVGPKQLEWTLQLPVDVIWQRPRRVRAADLNLQSVGERLVSQALVLVADVRQAFADAVIAEQRLALAGENAAVARQLAAIADARLRAGDISDLEARAARNDAAQIAADQRFLAHERDVARTNLFALIGLAPMPSAPLQDDPNPPPCRVDAGLVETALASRPDVRAAELAIEAAAGRASWERSRLLTFMATLDANGAGIQGYEMGPGLIAELPVLSRNQGLIQRADADVIRVSQAYRAVRFQVATDVRLAAIRLEQSQEAARIWSADIVPSLETEGRQASGAYQAGELALLSVLDANRRLLAARGRELDVNASVRRARVLLERSLGRACATS